MQDARADQVRKDLDNVQIPGNQVNPAAQPAEESKKEEVKKAKIDP